MSTNAHNPKPVDLGKSEPYALTSLGVPKNYNLNFEPNASKYDNKLVIDKE